MNSTYLSILLGVVALIAAGGFIIKGYNAKGVLFSIGITLMAIAYGMGNAITKTPGGDPVADISNHIYGLFENRGGALGGGFARFSALAYERGFKFSFAIFDVDHFKIVNDTKGHLAGDQILKQIADTIHEEIDRRHLFIRYGGDEFVLLALHYDLAAMVAFCEHLRGILEQRLDGVTLSFGVSTWHGKKDRLQALIDRADRALYLSKERGRNTVSAENDEGAA